MVGTPRKDPAAKTGHRSNDDAPPLAVLAGAPAGDQAPPAMPPGRWLKVTSDRWARYWSSQVAWTQDDADDPVAVRWVANLDEWERAKRQLRREGRFITGSMGQKRLNPLTGYIRDLESAMRKDEAQMAIGALNRIRFRLGYTGPKPDGGDRGTDQPRTQPDDFDFDDPDAGVTWIER